MFELWTVYASDKGNINFNNLPVYILKLITIYLIWYNRFVWLIFLTFHISLQSKETDGNLMADVNFNVFSHTNRVHDVPYILCINYGIQNSKHNVPKCIPGLECVIFVCLFIKSKDKKKLTLNHARYIKYYIMNVQQKKKLYLFVSI